MQAAVLGWIKRHPVWSALAGLAVALILYKVLVPPARTYAYVAEAATQGEVVRTVTASGKLRALNTIKVGAEVSGQITRILVDYNSVVQAGQVLAEIDPTRVRARVQQAQAAVATAQAALATAEANAMRAQTDFDVQTRDYRRQSELVERGFVSKSRFDTSTSTLAGARASVRLGEAQIMSARAQISQASAELSSARLDLTRTVIVAPAAGVVINKLVEPGTTVVASFQTPTLFEIAADTTRMQVEASVDEADIGQIVEGQTVSFTVDAYPASRFPARVRQIRKAATENQNVVSYLVILDVNNPDGKLLPGMTANVEILTGKVSRVTRVPTAALRFRPRPGDRESDADSGGKDSPAKQPKGDVVFIAGADPYRPERRQVKVGLLGEDFVEIVSGLRPGEKVVVRSKSIVPKKTDPNAAANDDEESNAEPSAP